MRMLLKATFDLDKTNELMRSGKLGEVIESIYGNLNTEAVYFIAEDGQRTSLIFLDLNDPSDLPAVAEPFFHAFDAEIEVTPAFTLDEMPQALPAIEDAIKKYG